MYFLHLIFFDYFSMAFIVTIPAKSAKIFNNVFAFSSAFDMMNIISGTVAYFAQYFRLTNVTKMFKIDFYMLLHISEILILKHPYSLVLIQLVYASFQP
jgi:hypothetical protein